MIRRRSLCLLASAAVLTFATPARAQDDEFQAALDALAKGANEEAVTHLQNVLNADLSNAAAFQLMQRADHQVWLKMLTQGGELELVAKELLKKSLLGRKERQNNPDAIRELVKKLTTDDALERNTVVNQLGSDYGEYAVPILIYSLAEQSEPERRVNVMTALTRMGSDVVPPLIEVLDAPDAFLRRNVAITLGYIKDPRSTPVLARAAASDADAGVRGAAVKSLQLMGKSGEASALYRAQGDAYYREDPSVLQPYQYSDVIWHWEGNGLASIEVPRFLYAPEMAKKAYYRALALLAEPSAALAGIARCAVTEIGRLAEWKAAGQDVGAWSDRLKLDDLAAQIAGPNALDLALGWALNENDWIAAAGISRLLASAGKGPTANLQKALTASKSGQVQGEAAVALGSIAFRNREATGPDTVNTLARVASTEVLRIGAVIDPDEKSGRATVAQLTELGYHTNWWPTGARGLVAMHSIPGADLIVVSDKLADMTPRDFVNELRTEPRWAHTQVFVRASAPGVDVSAFGGKVNGVIAPGADIKGAAEAASKEPMNRDREEALALAARAAQALYSLAAGAKTDVSPAAEPLAGTLANRPDEVVRPALDLLAFVGGAGHVERVAAVLGNAERSEDVRAHAANALSGIFSRSGSVDAAVLKMLQDVAHKDASFAVRGATASALGRLDLSKDVRIELMRGLLAR